MRIATWNVKRVKPQGWKIAPAQRRRMADVDADIWILTETHIDHSPGDGYTGIRTPAITERRPADERWVGIWSRYPITPITEPPPRGRGTLLLDACEELTKRADRFIGHVVRRCVVHSMILAQLRRRCGSHSGPPSRSGRRRMPTGYEQAIEDHGIVQSHLQK